MVRETPQSEPASEQPEFKDVIAQMTDLARQIDQAGSDEEREALRQKHQQAIDEFSRISIKVAEINEVLHLGSGSPVAEA